MILVAEIVAVVLVWEVLRFVLRRWLARRWQRSITDFLRRHSVHLEQFRFIDRVWVRQALLQDPEIDRFAAERATERGVPMIAVRCQVEEYLDEIVPFFNLFSYYKLGAAAARNAVRFVYELVFDAESLEKARAAVPPGAVTVYVANHRSNADYVVLSVGALRQVALSYAVGEWARVWPLDTLFRSFGSYFVRRGEKDPLYHLVLRRYLQLVASRGLTTAFFLEGGLSRDGALRPPKIGLLDYLVGILKDQPDRVIAFVPVGLNFDRVLEDRHLMVDLGPPSRTQKLASLAKIVARMPVMIAAAFTRAALRSHQKYGYAAVSFGQPILLSDAMPDAVAVAAMPDALRRPRIAALADDLLAAVARVIPATPVPLVARAILAGAKDLSELRRGVREQIEVQRAAGRPIAEGMAFRGLLRERQRADTVEKAQLDQDIHEAEEAERTVDLALRLLGRRELVTMSGGALRVAPGGEALLAYYARSLDAPSWTAAKRDTAPGIGA